jgi:hypothetical protein
MATIEQRIAKLESLTPTGAGRITSIQYLAINPQRVCVKAFRKSAPNWERTEIVGTEFEEIQRGYAAKMIEVQKRIS